MMMSLDEVMKMTNEELEKVQLAKPKFHQKHPLFEGGAMQPPPNPISSSLDWVPAQAFGSTIPSNERRSLSASRARSDNSSSNIADLTASNTRMNKDSLLYASTGSIPAKTDLYADRKIELLTKKLKYLDDHIKTLDKENKQSNEKYQDLLNQQQKAVEHQKQDRKLIQTLRDQSQQMKLKLDLLMNSEEIRDKINHNYNTSLGAPPSMYSTATGNVVNPNTALLDPNHLEEFIISKIQSSLVNTIEETILKHEKLSQLRSQQQVTSSIASQKDHNRYLIDQITIFEKELLKQKNELNSIKSKQSVIDSLYSDVKSNISVKELENLENHKKQLKNYRLEFNTLLTQTQEQLDTKINTYQSQEKAITDIREQLDNSLEKLGNLFGDFDIKLTTLEKQQLQQNNMINILKNNEVLPLMDKVNEHDTTIQSMTSELEIMYGVRDDLQSQGEMQLLHTNKLTIIEKELSQLNNIIQTNTNNFELLQIEVKQNLPQQIDSKIQELSQYYERITSNQTQSIEILTKSMKKLKTKLNDIINNLKTLNSMKQQIEKLISELENKVIEEISHTYELQTTIQKNAHLSNYLNEKLINLENSMNNQEKKRLEEEKHDQQDLEHLVSGLQQSIDHRISLLKEEVEQRLKSTTQTNELKQFSQEFSQFKKDQTETQNNWSSQITKQIQSQLQTHELEIKQQCNNFQQQSRQIAERCSNLENQCESLIETMPVFNDTFSNISNKIEIIENKMKDCELEAKLLQETIQKQLHSFQEEHKKEIVKIEEEIKGIEKKNEEEGEIKERKDKDQKDKEESKKKISKRSSSKKKAHKRDTSPSSSSSSSSSAEESSDDNDEGDHRRTDRKSPRKSSPKHGRETRRRYEDDYDSNDEDRYDDHIRGSKDSRSQRRKGSPRYEDEEPSHSKHRRNRDRDDEDDHDHQYHRQGNSARRDRGSGGRYSQPSPSSRDHRSSKDHQNYSPRSYTSSRRHSYGESVSKPYRDERDYDDIVRQSRSSYDKRSPNESERRFEDDMTPSQKQRHSDQDSESKYDKQERLFPPSHNQSSRLNTIPPRPGPQNQRNNDRHYHSVPDKKQPSRYSSSPPVVGDTKSRESPSVASSLRDEWHGITSDLSSPEGGMIGGGSGGRKSYYHEPSIESLDDHSQNLSKDRKGGEDEEEVEEADDEEGSRHPSLDHHPPPTQQKEGIGDEEEDVSLPEEELKSLDEYIRSLNTSNLSSSTNQLPSSSGITNSYRKDSDELVLLAPETVDRMTLRESEQEDFLNDEEVPSAPTFSSSPTQKYSPHTLVQGKVKGQRANIPGAINQKLPSKLSQPKQGLQFPAEVTNSQAEGGIIDYSLKDRPLLRQSTATSSTIATGIAIPSYETFPPATLTSLSSLSLAPILEETAALIEQLKRDKESEEEEKIRKEVEELEKREEEMRHKNVQVANDQGKYYTEDAEIDAPTDFAKFHELMDQLHSDIVALDLQSIKQQTFDEFYSSNKDILSSPRRALLATTSVISTEGKEEVLMQSKDLELNKKGTIEADEEDDEDEVGGGSVIPASDASVMNIDDKREDESIFTFESSSARLTESRPPKQIIPRIRETLNVREPSRLLAQEHFDEVVTIKSLSSDSSSSANKKPLASSPLSTASSASSSPASQNLSSPEDSKHSLNELAKTSLKELNKSLIQYYDDEDDSYLKENIIKPSKGGKQEDNREEEESSSVSDQRHTHDEDSDDDESEDSLDYIQIYTPKDLNAMKQTETLAKDDIDARGSQRLPELDLLSEFESIINRPKHHSSPPSAVSSSPHVVSSSEKAVEATMNWQALVNEHDISKEEVDALDIPSDIFDVNEEEEGHHNNQDEDDISSMKDDVVIMREVYPPSSSHRASNIPFRPFSSSHQSMNISSSMLLDDFDQEVEEIKEFLESDSPPRQYHKEYQQYNMLSRSGGSVDSRSSAAIDGVLDEAQYQQRLQSLSEKKRKHRMHFIASLKQHN